MQLNDYIDRFQKLRVDKRGGHERPHKPCMLLAVIGLAEAGRLKVNSIQFDQPLLDRYYSIFERVRTDTDHANPNFPFFHLRSEGFWHPQPLPGREAVLEAMDSARSISAITNNIDHVQLDDALFKILNNAEERSSLREMLLTRWFGSKLAKLKDIQFEDRYESRLREAVGEPINDQQAEYTKPVRDAAFRRVVIEAYDFRCAATGTRLVLPGQQVLVQAAHLIPFSDSQDDDPCNGIALTPDIHWAMDRNFISPGPDLLWHVSPLIEQRITDNQPLLSLHGRELLLPLDERFWPREDALAARLDALNSQG
jgi:putative restriction endonuclease